MVKQNSPPDPGLPSPHRRRSAGFGYDLSDPQCPLYGVNGLPNWDGLGELHEVGSSIEDLPRERLYGRGGMPDKAVAAAASAVVAVAAAAAPAPEKTFIAIELVDSDGQPVASARYQIKLEDGSLKEGTLDGSGKARIEGVAPGQAVVSFLELHGEDWA